jgi:glycerol-3-phosphate acyltransferase PlsY
MLSLYCIATVIAYLLGSIPFGFVLVKVFRGQDIRLSGSGNIGATNVARSGAKALGIATLALDALKGSLAVAVALLLSHTSMNYCSDGPCVASRQLMSAAALAAILGHMFPVWLRFKGGKGVATALGVFVVLFPEALLFSLAIFLIVVVLTRFVSLGSILAAISFPIAAYFFNHATWQALAPVLGICALVIAKHHQNIGRLLAGTEHRFGAEKPL